jgi:hypothetical protein
MIQISISPRTDADIEAIKAGTWFLYFYGGIKYSDGFGRFRCHRFCYVHQANGDQWEQCPTNNGEDEHCEAD